MEFLVGLLSGVGLFVVVGGSSYLGYRQGRKKNTPATKDEEDARKANDLRKEFMSLMTYDVNKALERKRVNHSE